MSNIKFEGVVNAAKIVESFTNEPLDEIPTEYDTEVVVDSDVVIEELCDDDMLNSIDNDDIVEHLESEGVDVSDIDDFSAEELITRLNEIDALRDYLVKSKVSFLKEVLCDRYSINHHADNKQLVSLLLSELSS